MKGKEKRIQKAKKKKSPRVEDKVVAVANPTSSSFESVMDDGLERTHDIREALLKDMDTNPPTSISSSESQNDQVSDILAPTGFSSKDVLAKENELDQVVTARNAPLIRSVNGVEVPSSSLRRRTLELEQLYGDYVFANLEVGLSMEDFEGDLLRAPLIRRAIQRAKNQARLEAGLQPMEEKEEGEGASIKKTVFTILKSFVGSGILFLPKGFANAGLALSIVILIASAVLSTICMLRLAECAAAFGTNSSGAISYGSLGNKAFGKWARVAVNTSLVLSQLGFCCSYLIFIEKNISDVVVHLTDCRIEPVATMMILLQVPIYTPLTWVRKIKYFAMTNLVADVLILFGLSYIICYSATRLAHEQEPSDWVQFNPKHWSIFLGTAVYVFEGVGLTLPICAAMDAKTRHRFPQILSYTLVFLVFLYTTFAGIVYITFGTKTQSVVTLNLPSQGIQWGTMAVQLAYSIALVFSYPLMLYPALTILEGLCIPSLKHTRLLPKGTFRWKKNFFRFLLVLATAGISLAGMNELDNFVSLIGSFCSVPLSFIYPCLFHSKLLGHGHLINGLIALLGLIIMVFATYQTIRTWSDHSEAMGYCEERAHTPRGIY